MALRTQQEEAKQVQRDLEQQLNTCQREILELQGLRVQIEAKEEIEERLVREKEELASRLSVAEHQLAMLKAGHRAEGRQEVDGGGREGEGGEEVMEDLRRLASENESLREQ